MKRIGVLIGTDDEPVSNKYYRENKKLLQVLTQYEYDISDYIPYDAAIFAEIHSEGKKNNFEVVPLFGHDLSLQECNECDFIFCVYEGVYSFFDGGMKHYQKHMNILKKTSARVYPSHKTQDFIIQKHKYMKYLTRKGYTIIPTYYISLKSINYNSMMRFIEKNNIDIAAIKPELGSFKKGFETIPNPTIQSLKKAIQPLQKKGYKNLLLQPFVEEFNKFGEIKTYWIHQKNIYSYKQQWKDGEGVFSDESSIETDVLKECLHIGKQLLLDIGEDIEPLLHCRIDFACCMNNEKRCREYFINEIEICPTIGEQESNGKAYKMLAKHIIKTCKQ